MCAKRVRAGCADRRALRRSPRMTHLCLDKLIHSENAVLDNNDQKVGRWAASSAPQARVCGKKAVQEVTLSCLCRTRSM